MTSATAKTTVGEVLRDARLDGFAHFIFPTEYRFRESLRLDGVGELLPYHSCVRTETTVDVVNELLERSGRGETVFYDIYSEQEKQRDRSKRDAGLFFLRGEPNAPFAVICAGGGFFYVGSIHESLPHALELSRRGFNAFALKYRTDSARDACEDLAAALTFIFANADTLGVSTGCYSLWGGSAGARVAAYLGSHGAAAFGGADIPRAGTVIMQYTGHSDYTRSEPPTFACVGERDGIASPRRMRRRIEVLRTLGVDAEFHEYPNIGHGFGLGIGTSAEGWLDDAVRFWRRQMK